LLAVIDDFAITKAIFTITRDNASNNTVMLFKYEQASTSCNSSTIQPWSFTVKEGDVRCVAHIINLAVQAALSVLKAIPSDEAESYRVDENNARFISIQDDPIYTALSKLQKHIYVFRNRRLWKDALQSQCIAVGIKPIQLSLNMPVRWNSTYQMLFQALKLQGPITAYCASQTLDAGMKDIVLTALDWSQLHDLLSLFQIFVRPSEQFQAEQYPTLNKVVPQYLRMINKLKAYQEQARGKGALVEACTAAINKLDDYYTLATSQQASHSIIATICDPRLN